MFVIKSQNSTNIVKEEYKKYLEVIPPWEYNYYYFVAYPSRPFYTFRLNEHRCTVV